MTSAWTTRKLWPTADAWIPRHRDPLFRASHGRFDSDHHTDRVDSGPDRWVYHFGARGLSAEHVQVQIDPARQTLRVAGEAQVPAASPSSSMVDSMGHVRRRRFSTTITLPAEADLETAPATAWVSNDEVNVEVRKSAPAPVPAPTPASAPAPSVPVTSDSTTPRTRSLLQHVPITRPWCMRDHAYSWPRTTTKQAVAHDPHLSPTHYMTSTTLRRRHVYESKVMEEWQ